MDQPRDRDQMPDSLEESERQREEDVKNAAADDLDDDVDEFDPDEQDDADTAE